MADWKKIFNLKNFIKTFITFIILIFTCVMFFIAIGVIGWSKDETLLKLTREENWQKVTLILSIVSLVLILFTAILSMLRIFFEWGIFSRILWVLEWVFSVISFIIMLTAATLGVMNLDYTTSYVVGMYICIVVPILLVFASLFLLRNHRKEDKQSASDKVQKEETGKHEQNKK